MLTPRDLDLLVLVGLSGYLGSDQLARDLFPSPDRCRRRLRQLFDAGFLAVSLASSTVPNLVSLTAQGIEAVGASLPEVAARLRRPGPIRTPGVAHHLAVVDVRLFAAALGAAGGAALTAWSNAGGDLGRERGLGDLGLEPDGLAVFGARDRELCIAVEVDLGTEPLGVLAAKFERYVAAFDAGALDALWIVVGSGSERRASMAAVATEHGLSDRVQVLDLADVRMRPVDARTVAAFAGMGQRP